MAKFFITTLFCAAISIMSTGSLHAVTAGQTNICAENVLHNKCLGKSDSDLALPAIANKLQHSIVVPFAAHANSVFEPFHIASNDDIREQIRAKLKTLTREQILANEQSPWMLGCRTSCACKYMEWDNNRCEGMSVETPSEEEFKQCNLRCEAYIYLKP